MNSPIFPFLLFFCFFFFGQTLDGELPIQLTQSPQNAPKSTHIPHFNVFDQCFPIQEANPKLFYFHQILLSIPRQALCGGHGFLLCYPGQLDEGIGQRGMRAVAAYQLQNLGGNIVAEECQKLGQKIGADFGGPLSILHGILADIDPTGQNVRIQLSTANHTFSIPRSKFDQFLALKLASPLQNATFLSADPGPFWKSSFPKNRIPVPLDDALRSAYFRHIHQGVFLKPFAGLWSLGLDILPTAQNQDSLQFLTERSKCCPELDAWFMNPMASQPSVQIIPHKMNIFLYIREKDKGVRLGEGMEMDVRGKVRPNASRISFNLKNLFQQGDNLDKILELKMECTFPKNWGDCIFEQKFVQNGKIQSRNSSLAKDQLFRGAHFQLHIKFSRNKLEIQFNCHQISNIDLGEPIIFQDFYNLTIEDPGNVELFQIRPKLPNDFGKIRSWAEKIEAGQGIYLHGKIENVGEENGPIQVGIYQMGQPPVLMLSFVVDIAKSEYRYGSEYSQNKEIEFGSVSLELSDEDEIEMFFLWRGGKFRIWIGRHSQGAQVDWKQIAEFDPNPNNLLVDILLDFVKVYGKLNLVGKNYSPKVSAKLRWEGKIALVDLLNRGFQLKGAMVLPALLLVNERPVAFPEFKLEFKGGQNKVQILVFHFQFNEEKVVKILEPAGNLTQGPLSFENLFEIGKPFDLKVDLEQKLDEEGMPWHFKMSIMQGGKMVFGKEMMGNYLEAINWAEVDGDLMLLNEPGE